MTKPAETRVVRLARSVAKNHGGIDGQLPHFVVFTKSVFFHRKPLRFYSMLLSSEAVPFARTSFSDEAA